MWAFFETARVCPKLGPELTRYITVSHGRVPQGRNLHGKPPRAKRLSYLTRSYPQVLVGPCRRSGVQPDGVERWDAAGKRCQTKRGERRSGCS